MCLFVILISHFILSCMMGVSAESTVPDVKADSVLLFDASRGQILYSKNPQAKYNTVIANTMMTVYLALEKSKTSALVTISNEAINQPDAQLNMRVGEKYPIESLAYAALLTNAPDAAVSLAEYVGGSEKDFVSLMNETAGKLEMKNTHFTSSAAKKDDQQYSTAEDLSIFIRYALNNVDFKRIFSTPAKPWCRGRCVWEWHRSP